MQHFDRMIGFAAVAFCAVAVSGCSAPSRMVAQAGPTQMAATASQSADPAKSAETLAAPYAPPPELAEIPPPAPSPNSLWRVGHWVWSGVNYLWTRGHYIERPTPTANWSRGYWQQGPDGWVWVEGHWTS